MTLSVRHVVGRSVCHDFLNMGEHSYIYTSIGKLVLNETLQNIIVVLKNVYACRRKMLLAFS